MSKALLAKRARTSGQAFGLRDRALLFTVVVGLVLLASVSAQAAPEADGSSLLIAVNAGTSADLVARPLLVPHEPGEAIALPPLDVPAGGLAAAALAEQSGVPAGAYGARPSELGPLAMYGRTSWSPTTGESLTGPVSGAGEVLLPLAIKVSEGWSTFVSVINLDPTEAAAVTVTGVRTMQASVDLDAGFAVPADSARGYWMGEGPLADVPDGWSGALRFTADRPIAVHAWVARTDGGPAVFDVLGQPVEHASGVLYAPRFWAEVPRSDSVGGVSSSRFHVSNSSDRIAVLVTVELRGEDGVCAGEVFRTATKTVRAGSNLTFDFGADPDPSTAYDVEVPPNCAGTARIFTSLGSVSAAVVEERRDAGGDVLAAAGFPALPESLAASEVVAPWRWPGSVPADGATTLRAMNVGTDPATVSLTARSAAGSPVACPACEATIAPGSSRSWVPSDLPEGAAGSSVALSLVSDQPLAVSVDAAAGGSDISAALAAPAASEESGDLPRALPALLNESGLPPVVRDPTPTVTPTSRATATSPIGPRPPARTLTPGTPPTPVPTRTSSPTPTEVPTEVPLGEVVVQNLGLEAAADVSFVATGGADGARVEIGPLKAGRADSISFEDLTDRLLGAPHGVRIQVADGGGSGSGDPHALGVLALHRSERGASAAYAAPSAGREVIVPMAAIDHFGRTTSFAVQNVGDAPAAVSVGLYPSGRGSSPTRGFSVWLAPGEAAAYRLGESLEFVAVPPNTPDGFLGWLRMTSDRPLVAASVVDHPSTDRAVHTVGGQPSTGASRSLLAHGVFAPEGGRDLESLLTVLNPSGSPAEVRATLVGVADGCEGTRSSAVPLEVAAYSVREVDLAGAAGLPAGCAAVALLESDAPVHASVTVSRPGGPDRAGAAGLPAVALDAAPGISPFGSSVEAGLPRVRFGAGGLGTSVWAYNPGDAPAQARLEVLTPAGEPLAGCGADCMAEVPAGGAITWDIGGLPGAPSSGSASARVVSDVPLHVAALDLPEASLVDLSAYIATDAASAVAPRWLPLANWTIKPGYVTGPTPTASPWPTATVRPTSLPGPSSLPPPRPTTEPPGADADWFGLQNMQRDRGISAGGVLYGEEGTPAEPFKLAPVPAGAFQLAVRGRSSADGSLGSGPRAASLFSDGASLPFAVHSLASGAVAAQGAAAAGTDLIVPLLLGGYTGQYSFVHVQAAEVPEADGLGVDAEIGLYEMGGERVATLDRRVGAGALTRIDMREIVRGHDLPRRDGSGFMGFMRLRGPKPLVAASVIKLEERSERWAYDVPAMPVSSASEVVVAPNVRSNAEGVSSAVMLFNPGDEPALVASEYLGTHGPCAGEKYSPEDSFVIEPHDFRTVYLGPSLERILPSGCEATAKYAATVPLVGLVNGVLAADRGVMVYPVSSVGNASTSVAVPMARNRSAGRSTTLYVMYPGEAAADVGSATVMLIDQSGKSSRCGGCELRLESGGAAKLALGSDPFVPAGWLGTAWVDATVPVVVLAVDEPAAGEPSVIGGVAAAEGDIAAWLGHPVKSSASPSTASLSDIPVAVLGYAPAPPVPGPTSEPPPWRPSAWLWLPSLLNASDSRESGALRAAPRVWPDR